jgi:hypothetical protein
MNPFFFFFLSSSPNPSPRVAYVQHHSLMSRFSFPAPTAAIIAEPPTKRFQLSCRSFRGYGLLGVSSSSGWRENRLDGRHNCSSSRSLQISASWHKISAKTNAGLDRMCEDNSKFIGPGRLGTVATSLPLIRTMLPVVAVCFRSMGVLPINY